MLNGCALKSYSWVDWLKFGIPISTSSVALVLCLYFIVDCRSTINVKGEWHGIFAHASGEGSCVSYSKISLDMADDLQLLATQIGSVVVVALGFPLWGCLILSPFWRPPNEVWPKIISISVALVAGNAQLYTVVKFIRLILSTYPNEKVYYDNRGVVISSTFFWLLTAVAISLCGVKPPPRPLVSSQQDSSGGIRVGKLVVSASEDTKETNDDPGIDLQMSASAETKDTNDLEEGIVKIYSSSSEVIRENEAIEMSLSESLETP